MTRATMTFYTKYQNQKEARVEAYIAAYQSGHPEDMIPLLIKFRKQLKEKFKEKEAQSYRHMFNDGGEVASQFVKMCKPDFNDIIIRPEPEDDVDHIYEIYTTYGSLYNELTIPWLVKYHGLEGRKQITLK